MRYLKYFENNDIPLYTIIPNDIYKYWKEKDQNSMVYIDVFREILANKEVSVADSNLNDLTRGIVDSISINRFNNDNDIELHLGFRHIKSQFITTHGKLPIKIYSEISDKAKDFIKQTNIYSRTKKFGL